MEKPMKISRGNNLGVTSNEDFSDYLYRGNFEGIYDNPIFQWRSLIMAYGNKDFTYATKWINNLDEDEFDKMSTSARMKRNIENLTNDDKKLLAELMQENKDYSKPFLQKIQEFYEITSGGQAPVPEKIVDGKVEFKDRPYLLHNIPLTNIEDIKSRKELGILASEWFGMVESAGECRFCASFSKTVGKIVPREEKRNKDVLLRENTNDNGNLTLIVDTSSPDFQQLLHLDFFEYLRKKETGDLSEYSSGELKFLSRLEEWNGGKTDSQDKILQTIGGGARSAAQRNKDWSMIPGGVPSKYVCAIMTRNIEPGSEQEKLALEAGKVFGVPVINSKLEVLKEKDDEKKI